MQITLTIALSVWLLNCVAADVVFNEDFPDEEFEYEVDEGGLVQVLIVTRHGQRTPKNPYPNDPWKNAKYWPEGWMQLTEEGAKQHRQLGKWIRQRYPGLIPVEYKTSDILVRSTGIARTLASAFALSSALYPGQAVPIHSAPSKSDKLFSPHKNCPAFTSEMDSFMSTLDIRMEEYKRRPFYEWVARQMGRDVHGLEVAESLYSLLMIEQQRGHQLPKWTRSIYPQPLKNLTGRFLSRSSATPRLARLRYGPLLKDIVDHAEHAGTRSKTQKLLVYSGHDFTIVGLLNSLGLFKGEPAGFAAALIFEVRRGFNTSGNTVGIFYRNDSNAEPKSLAIERCGRPCHLKTLRKLVAHLLPDDIEAECFAAYGQQFAVRSMGDVSLLWAVAFGSAAFGALMVICCSKLYVCGRPPLWRLYQPNLDVPRPEEYARLKGENYPLKRDFDICKF